MGNFLYGNRETSVVSEKNKSDRSGKDVIRNPDMNVAEESDRLEVPEKAVNEAKAWVSDYSGPSHDSRYCAIPGMAFPI